MAAPREAAGTQLKMPVDLSPGSNEGGHKSHTAENPGKTPGSALSAQDWQVLNTESRAEETFGTAQGPISVLQDRLNVRHLNVCMAHVNRLETGCWVWLCL